MNQKTFGEIDVEHQQKCPGRSAKHHGERKRCAAARGGHSKDRCRYKQCRQQTEDERGDADEKDARKVHPTREVSE